MKNYCPVLNLNFLSKLLEQIIALQLNSPLSTYSLMNKYQSAYKHGHFTKSALLKLQNYIFINMACGKSTVLVLLDLLAESDTIEHNILNRLSSVFGLGGTVLKWCMS